MVIIGLFYLIQWDKFVTGDCEHRSQDLRVAYTAILDSGFNHLLALLDKWICGRQCLGL